MNVLELNQLIGETTEYDKKQALEVKKPKSWCKSLSAFANGIGRKLVWGISDDSIHHITIISSHNPQSSSRIWPPAACLPFPQRIGRESEDR